MNTPSTTPRDFDQFESALLTELREHVAAHPVHENATAPMPPHRHRGRWAAGVAVAAAAATAFVVVAPGGPSTSQAYAVEQTGTGDVVVTIHRLEDSVGLENALRDHGIEADVSFNPTVGMKLDESGGGQPQPAEPAAPGEVPAIPDCGLDQGEPATLSHEADAWVLRIPAESPLQDRDVQISTGPDGELGVAYAANDPGSSCAVMSVNA